MPEPATKGPARRATHQHLLAVPEHLVAEIVDGELVTSPRPALRHARASSAVGAVVFGNFDSGRGGSGPGGWWILNEPELRLRDDVIVPDLAGWRRERMPVLPDRAACELAPDWVCAVVSPATARHDRVRKAAVYARERVSHLWLVDPLSQTLEVFRLEGERWVRLSAHGGSERVRAEPFEAAELDLSRWWVEPAPDEVAR